MKKGILRVQGTFRFGRVQGGAYNCKIEAKHWILLKMKYRDEDTQNGGMRQKLAILGLHVTS